MKLRIFLFCKGGELLRVMYLWSGDFFCFVRGCKGFGEVERFLSFFWKWWLLWQSFLLVAGFFLFWENSVWCCKCSAEWLDFFISESGMCWDKDFGGAWEFSFFGK